MSDAPSEADLRALRQLEALGGTVRTAQAIRCGIHPRTLYRLRDAGLIERLSRGTYRVARLAPPSLPDLLVVATRLPKAVLCLTSALAFHELTEQIPHRVFVALPRGAQTPRLDSPPLHVVRTSTPCFDAGIERHDVDGIDLRVYEPAKTVVDCFKFRSLVGLDVAIAALKRLRQRRDFDVEHLLGFARTCRVERILRPYVEALL
jgi:predicted transcriptional regulator of viral defense system